MPPPDAQFNIDHFLRNLTHRPGVYRMLDEHGKYLYVGKAKNLKKRVSSYFQRRGHGPRIEAVIARTRQVEVTVTSTEAEALLLENNLIKEHRPRYNVVLRDDKSYPYIYVSIEQDYPRLSFHRGARRGKGRYFGPYPNAGAVRETLNLLQKLFKVRQCEDSFCRNRTRPCLQYQIDRCTAPCVGYVGRDEYRTNAQHAIKFLEGKTGEVIEALIERMEAASARLDFEHAAAYRNRIESLRRITEQQYVSGEGGDLDIIAVSLEQGLAGVQVFNIRAGHNLGNKSFFPQAPEDMDEAELLTGFMGQYYLNREIPAEIIVSHRPADHAALTEMLATKRGQGVKITSRVRGARARWLDIANRNVAHAVRDRLASKAGMQRRVDALQEELDLAAAPARMECFDISHTLGEATVASCVVFDAEGPVKSDYRRFNITGVEPGDDYAAIRQALTRRYTRLKVGEGKLPDILFIDGGKGQVRQAVEVLEELQVAGVTIIGVAKGEGRRPGLESLIPSDRRTPVVLPSSSPALHLVQQIRDEAHRFAITGHRQRRAKSRTQSPLEQIHGLGPKRRQSLLRYFGGMRALTRAGVEELAKVPGISADKAREIYDVFHAN
ncbi:MAG: excinuclease ABC subunit UvrC [Gammaproteobacteria bacterium]